MRIVCILWQCSASVKKERKKTVTEKVNYGWLWPHGVRAIILSLTSQKQQCPPRNCFQLIILPLKNILYQTVEKPFKELRHTCSIISIDCHSSLTDLRHVDDCLFACLTAYYRPLLQQQLVCMWVLNSVELVSDWMTARVSVAAYIILHHIDKISSYTCLNRSMKIHHQSCQAADAHTVHRAIWGWHGTILHILDPDVTWFSV